VTVAVAAGWVARDAWLGRGPWPAPTREGVPEGPAGTAWARIHGGSFMMGAEDGDPGERPVHKVRVPTLDLARTEATVGQYAKCVSAGACTPPRAAGSGCSEEERPPDDPPRAVADDLPVTCVDWGQARAFCAWSGGRLCSESEWAYAARSGDEANSYPWGSEEPTCERAVFRGLGCAPRGPSRPCSKAAGSNQWGACDLAGNVWEWVEDDWHESYVGAPADGAAWVDSPRAAMRVARGGSFASSENGLRMAHRNRDEPGAASDRLGIRCCRTPQR
jgi:formylglycine-generating enzyme required for sulfatase activity